MKSLKVRHIDACDVKAENIPALMQSNGIVYNRVEEVDWPDEYPYCPNMEFAIAYTDDAILIHYRVTEQSVRAVAQQDHDSVWEDSCVEFFSCPAGDGQYYNVECNCTGKLLIACGPDRHQRTPAPAEIMQGVQRWASLGADPFDTKKETTSWQVALRIPLTTYFRHQIRSLKGQVITGNFYKCGDKLPVPHFISWNHIGTPTPDFHCPEYFGQLEFL